MLPLDPRSIFVQAAPLGGRAWADLARRVERLGLGGLYVADHPGTAPSPFVALAAAASVTDRITLGTCVVNAGLWHPIDLASAVATLDLVSDGRALLGLGAGHTPAEWTTRGRTRPSGRDRVLRLEEVATASSRLLRGEAVDLDGAHVSLSAARLDPPLAPRHDVQIMIGGNGPRVLDVAARHADVVGVTGLGRTLADGHRHSVDWSPDRVAQTLSRIRRSADAARRRPAIEALVQRVQITDDAEHVAAALARAVEGATAADVLSAPFVWMGTIDEIRDGLRRHVGELGIDRWVVREDALDAVSSVLDLPET